MSGPNMDYCKFQNTLRALEQCCEGDEIYKRQTEEGDEDEIDREAVENTADEYYRKKLIELCQEIARNTED